MPSSFDLEAAVEVWLDRHRQAFLSKAFVVKSNSLEALQPDAPAKTVLRFKGRTVLMQIDLWSNGHADVMVLKKGLPQQRHLSFSAANDLSRVLDESWRRVSVTR